MQSNNVLVCESESVHIGVSEGVVGGFSFPKRILLGIFGNDEGGEASEENQTEKKNRRRRRFHMNFCGIGSTRLN